MCSATRILLVALLASCVLNAYSVDYHIQVILPLSGPDGLRYQQWASVARYAASQVTAGWASSGNALVVDVLDYEASYRGLASAGAAAISNTSVVGILVDDVMADSLAPYAANGLVRLYCFNISILDSL